MNCSPTRDRIPQARPRAGFTLVELLMVIVILALLMALLLPAITNALRTGQNSAVQADINRMATALAQFKSSYGVYPPSRIILSETGNYDVAAIQKVIGAPYNATGQLAHLTGLVQRSVSSLRRIWPQLALNTIPNGGPPTINAPQTFYDFNGNGVLDDTPIVLQGPECLVFFLGGLPAYTGSSTTANAVGGFANNRVNPFMNAATFPNRTNGLVEFSPGRFADLDLNGYPEYLDGLNSDPKPLVYFSAYEGLGYDPDDYNYAKYDGSIYTYEEGTFTNGSVASPLAGYLYAANIPGRTNPVLSPGPNPYTDGSQFPSAGSNTPPNYINKSSFQIISAGQDNLYGIGGEYDANATGESLPLVRYAGQNKNFLTSDVRVRESDNLTNFKAGRLK